MANNFTIKVQADIENNNTWSLDLLPYMEAGITELDVSRGVDLNREYNTSELTFNLTNRLGTFFINNSSSSIFKKWTIGTPIRILFNKNSIDYPCWSGYITNLSYENDYMSKTYICSVTASDLSYLLDQTKPKTVPLDKNLNISAAIKLIAAQSPSIKFFGDSFLSKSGNPSSALAGNGNSIAFHPNANFVAIAHATTPFVTVYTYTNSAFGTKLTAASPVPAGTGNAVAWSPNGLVLGVAHDTSPYFSLYAFNPVSGSIGTRFKDPSTLPTGTGKGIAFSGDSNYVAIAHTTSPYVSVYPITNNTSTGLTIVSTGADAGASWTNPSNIIADDVTGTPGSPWTGLTYAGIISGSTSGLQGTGPAYSIPTTAVITAVGVQVEYSPQHAAAAQWTATLQLLKAGALTGNTKTFSTSLDNTLTKMEIGGDMWGATLTRADLLAANFGVDIKFSKSGISTETMFIDAVKINIYYSDPSIGAKIANPGTLPTGNAESVAFSETDTHIAVGHATSPYISVYPWTGSAFGTKLADLATSVGSTANSVKWSNSNKYFGVATASSPYIRVYRWYGNKIGDKLKDPPTLPTGVGNEIDFSLDNEQVAIAHTTSPYISVYNFDDKAIKDKLTDFSTLPAGNGNGIHFDSISGNLGVAHDASPYVASYQSTNKFNLDIAVGTIPYLVSDTSSTLWQTMVNLAKHELGGYIYVSADGKIRFKNRQNVLYDGAWYAMDVGYLSVFAIIKNAIFDSRDEDRAHKIRIKTASYVESTAGTVVYQEPRGSATSDSIDIPAYSVYNTTITYNVSAVSKIEPLTLTTDYTINSAIGGGGSDQSSVVTTQIINYGNQGEAWFFNNSASTVYLTKFQIRGIPLGLPTNDSILSYDEPLKVGNLTYGLLNNSGVFTDEFNFNPDSRKMSAWAISQLKIKRYINPRLDLEIMWNDDNVIHGTINQTMVDLDLLSLVYYNDIVDVDGNAITNGLNLSQMYRVYSITHKMSPGNLITSTLSLLPVWMERNVDKCAWDEFNRSSGAVMPSGHTWISVGLFNAQYFPSHLMADSSVTSMSRFSLASNVVVEVLLKNNYAVNTELGLIFRYSNTNNYWKWYSKVDGSSNLTFKLAKVVFGVEIIVFSATGASLFSTPPNYLNYRVICYDQWVLCYLNYELVYVDSSGDLSGGTSVGLMSDRSGGSAYSSSGGYYDNFYAQSLSV